MSKIPNSSQQSRIRIAQVIHVHGPLTRGEVRDRLPVGANHLYNTNRAIDSMLVEGQLVADGELLRITDDVSEYIAGLLEIEAEKQALKATFVRPADPREFRPLSQKYIPDARGTRDDAPVREYHPVSCSSKIPPHRVDAEDKVRFLTQVVQGRAA